MLVLASGSPRRRGLLERFTADFVVRPADVDETTRAGEGPEDLVRRLATDKAQAGLDAAVEPDVVVLAADTVVAVDGEVLAKPTDHADARRMLRLLSARTHRVLTGVAVATRVAGGRSSVGPAAAVSVEVVATEVTFEELSEADVDWYVATDEPLDKAGAYGIQAVGGVFVSSIRGSYDNVVGLPLAVTRRLLADAGVDLLHL